MMVYTVDAAHKDQPVALINIVNYLVQIHHARLALPWQTVFSANRQ
jgi:hypothetical protein